MTDQLAKKPVDGESSTSRQVLTFCLGAETYGVDILRVQEIRGWSPVTRIPKSPPHVLGVLNLRGSIVPIVDLRVRFSFERAEFTPLTVIIVPTGHRQSAGELSLSRGQSTRDAISAPPIAIA